MFNSENRIKLTTAENVFGRHWAEARNGGNIVTDLTEINTANNGELVVNCFYPKTPYFRQLAYRISATRPVNKYIWMTPGFLCRHNRPVYYDFLPV